MSLRTVLALSLLVLPLAGCSPASEAQVARDERIQRSPHFRDGEFRNLNGVEAQFFSAKAFGSMWDTLFGSRIDPAPASPPPVVPIQAAEWAEPSAELAFAWLGHSSLLVSLDGLNVLVDPVLEERASPYTWAGPKRFHPAPGQVETLPRIDLVIISHEHYDHLEEATLVALKDQVRAYVVPLGVGAWLEDWGIPPEQIQELQWGERFTLEALTVQSTPAIHYANRGLFDLNEHLWSSWAVIGSQRRFFVSGDSGYFPGFRDVGASLGPFDVSFLKVGSYDESWKEIHMMPEEAVQEHEDLNGSLLVPTHWATFDLALHPWYEPVERTLVAAQARGVQVLTPLLGQRVRLDALPDTGPWWREVQ